MSKQARNPDFSALAHTRPVQVGTTLPASCGVGELFFNSGATDGSYIYSCTSANVWAPIGSGSLGGCTVANNNLTCPGDIQTGTGGQPGNISLYELVTNGSNSVSLSAPASVTGSYTLVLPNSGPQSGQTLAFGAPDVNGVSQASWQLPTLTEGLYAGLPAPCTEGNVFLFTDSLYSFARCTSGAWLHFFDGKAITPPSGLPIGSLLLPSPVTVNASHGYEQLYAPGGSSLALRSFPAPASSPYTKYIVMRVPAILDQANDRSWYAGFADPSGNSQVLGCGVGATTANGFWCRVARFSGTGAYVSQDTSNIVVPYFTGTVVVALENDGTLLHFGISTDANTFYEIGSVAIASYLSSPASLVYGILNSAAGQNLALNFLGVY